MNLTDSRIEDYCRNHSTLPSEYCEKIAAHTRAHVPMAEMLVGPLEGSFLGWVVRAFKARRVLEIGTYTGYSALCMAEHLPGDGELVTCDVNAQTTALARKFWDASPHGSKIHSKLGPAADTLQKLTGNFDLVFIDADKDGYPIYFERALELLSPGGAIVLDNCLRDGRVLKSIDTVDSGTRAIMQLSQKISNRADLVCCLLPLRDGVMLVQRRSLSL